MVCEIAICVLPPFCEVFAVTVTVTDSCSLFFTVRTALLPKSRTVASLPNFPL